ncbi:MAG: glycosyltransferase [Lachnospiraceae bacterium]|nr:glycosyltransferase [Lachnospiraceae bacterium]
MNKKKILIVAPSNKGTIAMCSLNLWKSFLMNNSVSVKCVLIYKFQDGLKEFDDCEVCCTSNKNLFSKVFNIFYQLKTLKKIKRSFKPDLTVSTLFNCSIVNVLSGGNEKKIGIFHSPHKQVKDKGPIIYFLTLLVYKFIYPHLDLLSCVSEEVRNSIQSSFKSISTRKLKVIYNIHLVDQIKSKANESLDSAEEENLFNNNIILFCGRLDKNKAPDRLLRAYIKAGLQHNYQIVYIGQDTGIGKDIKLLTEKNGIINLVHFLGAKNNPYKYIKRSSMLVSSSYSEGLPGVLIESLALGTPVITTNSSIGVWEILGCEKYYEKKLSSLKYTSDGIITPNTGNDEFDDNLLAKAIKNYDNNQFKVPFEFKRKVSPESVVNQYLDIL